MSGAAFGEALLHTTAHGQRPRSPRIILRSPCFNAGDGRRNPFGSTTPPRPPTTQPPPAAHTTPAPFPPTAATYFSRCVSPPSSPSLSPWCRLRPSPRRWRALPVSLRNLPPVPHTPPPPPPPPPPQTPALPHHLRTHPAPPTIDRPQLPSATAARRSPTRRSRRPSAPLTTRRCARPVGAQVVGCRRH